MASQKKYRIPDYFQARIARRHHAHPPTPTPEQLQDNYIASYDLPLKRMDELKEELTVENLLGNMVSYDVVLSTWAPWYRPEKTFKSSPPRPVAVSGLKKLTKQGLLTPPRCPYAANPFRAASYGDMGVHQKTIDGLEHSVFRATHDGVECPFFVIIPKLSTDYSVTHHLFSEEERTAYDLEIFGDKGSSPSPSEPSPPSLQSVVDLDVSPSSSQTSISTSSFSSVSPSSSQTSISTSSPRPKPTPITRGSHHERQQKSHFTAAAAAARSSPDRILISLLLQNEKSKIYEFDWTLHPASDFKNGVPSILSRYDITLNPSGLQRVYQNLRYFNTGIGHLIREMNSTIGIPYTAFRTLLADNIICEGCQCMYSVDGFNAHIEYGKCSNTPALISVQKYSPPLDTVPQITLRTFPPGFNHRLFQPTEFIETPIGAAYLEWNSHVGIPEDVWIFVTTARIACETCELTRTFEGDRAHRDGAGLCVDPGQGPTSFIVTHREQEDEEIDYYT